MGQSSGEIESFHEKDADGRRGDRGGDLNFEAGDKIGSRGQREKKERH